MGEIAVLPDGIRALVGRAHQKLAGMESFSDSELGFQPLQLKIVPAMQGRNSVGKPGQLRFGRDVFDSVDVVFIKAHPFRTLAEGPEEKKSITCFSTNGREPHESVPAPKDTACQTCAYGQWDEGPGGKRVKPPCNAGVAFLGVRPDMNDLPFWFLCRGSSSKPAREFLRDMMQHPDIQGLCECVVRITTQEERNGGVIWYTPIFTTVNRLPLDRYRACVEAVGDAWYMPRVTEASEVVEVGGENGKTGTWDVPF